MGGPSPTMILPDPVLTGTAQIVDITSESGRIVGPPVPADGNEGDLLPFAEGAPGVVAGSVNGLGPDITYRILTCGGLYTAQWGWRYTDDDSAQVRGQGDSRFLHYGHDPYADDPDQGYGLCVFSSQAFNRLVCFRVGGTSSTTIQLRYRDFDDAPTTWTSTTVTLLEQDGSVFDFSITNTAAMDVVELPDGALRMVIRTGNASKGDLALFGSTDGGLTWTLYCSAIIQRATGANSGIALQGPVYLRRSGDWLRVSWVTSTGTLQSMVSSDRGATWTKLTDLATAVIDNGDNFDEYGGVALEGSDSADGLFLLHYIKTGETQITVLTARRAEDWTENTDLGPITGVGNLRRLTAVRDSTFLWLLIERDQTGGTGSDWYGRRYRLDAPTNPATYRNMGPFPGYNGTKRYTACGARAAFAGDSIAILAGLNDPDDSGNIEAYTQLSYLLGWTRRTLVSVDGYGISPATMFSDGWATVNGAPAASETDGNGDSPWTLQESGSTMSWTSDRYQVQTTNSGDYRRVILDQGTTPTSPWVDGGCFVFTMRQTAGASMDVFQAYMASAAGTTHSFFIATSFSAGSVEVRNGLTGAQLAIFSGLTLSEYNEIRVGCTYLNSTAKIEVAVGRIGDYSWQSVSGITLTPGAATSQLCWWGHLNGPGNLGAGVTTEWRDVWIREGSGTALGQYGFANPGTLNGRIADPFASYVTDDVYARWGGGGGFKGDTFASECGYTYGKANAFTPTQRDGWRSFSGATQTWTWNADPDNNVKRFQHDGIAFFGTTTRQIVIAYHTSNSWGSPSALDTLSLDIASGVTVDSVDGNTAVVNLPSNLLGSELVGHYLHDETTGETWAITEQIEAGGGLVRIHCGDETSTLASQGLGAGSTVALVASKGAIFFDQRNVYQYMRWSFSGAIAGITTTPATGDHRLAAFVAGTSHPFDVPMLWEHEDDLDVHVQTTTTVGAVNWAFEDAPPGRVFSAKIQGDPDGFREQLRNHFRVLTRINDKPLALVLDDTVRTLTTYYVRQDRTALRQQGWRQINGRWREIGDYPVEFVEQV